jgi:hypothetical protein
MLLTARVTPCARALVGAATKRSSPLASCRLARMGGAASAPLAHRRRGVATSAARGAPSDADRDAAFAAAQRDAPRPSIQEEAKTLVMSSR